ncbi:MAG: SPFH domain-containing protein [Phycisphaerales bacterium]|nr:SPFH domain-containing protein [Phycisphaerales bacterium]
MGIWDKLRGELIDIIEWLDQSNDTMVYRFERYGNEIKNGAKLVVREGQAAVFVNEGRIADVFPPGTYELTTRNLPILATLLGWKYGFESPFKAEVYFASTRRFTDLKWGTRNPVMLRDKEFGPVRLRAFGTYAMRVTDAGEFIKEIVGTDAHFTTDEITEQLRNIIIARFTDILGSSGIPILDLAGNYDELGGFVRDRIGAEFTAYGLELTKMLVENISLPPEVEEALDKRSSMGIIGDLSRYTQYQSAEALKDAANNPGGGASEGIGLGMGFAMAQHMAQSMSPGANANAGAGQTPPPLPTAAQYHLAVGGQAAGPFALDEIRTRIQRREVTKETLAWKTGMAAWVPAGEVPDLRPLFDAVPPPLPGSPPPIS